MPAAVGSAIGYLGSTERRRGYRDTTPVTGGVAGVAGRMPSRPCREASGLRDALAVRLLLLAQEWLADSVEHGGGDRDPGSQGDEDEQRHVQADLVGD